MKLINNIGLIGDGINTIPVMIDLAKKYGSLEVQCHPDNEWMYELIPKKYNITICRNDMSASFALDLHAAFAYGDKHNYYMSRCYHHQVGLTTPQSPLMPELDLPDIDVPVYDYVIAPFGRSAPDEQKLEIGKWVELAYEIYKIGNSVAILGNSNHDNMFRAYRAVNELDRPMVEVLNLINKCRKGVISIVTGISHLTYAVGAKNYLLTGQGTSGWGVNPDAKCLSGRVCDFTVEQVLNFIECH